MHFWNRARSPLLYAHRGANRECPENTLEAFARALALGADVLELDIHSTRDGVFVVAHDDTGTRVANVPSFIRDCDWAQVSQWDAGWAFVDASGEHPFRGKGVGLPRLESVLEAFPEVPLNVDVKGARPEQLGELLTCIRGSHAEDRVLLTSFSSGSIYRLRRLGYEGALGFSRFDVARLYYCPEWMSRRLGFAGIRVQVPTRASALDLGSTRFIDRCHRLGLAVDFWVVNDVKLAAALLERGADGIVTDEPGTMAGAFRHSPVAGAWRERH